MEYGLELQRSGHSLTQNLIMRAEAPKKLSARTSRKAARRAALRLVHNKPKLELANPSLNRQCTNESNAHWGKISNYVGKMTTSVGKMTTSVGSVGKMDALFPSF